MKTLLAIAIAACSVALGQTVDTAPHKFAQFTVATLPSAATWANYTVTVTDGVTAGDCTVGGGSKRVNCISDGSVWASSGGGSGSGDVVGPGSATDKCAARYNGTTGKIIQNSVVCFDNAGNVTGVLTLDVNSNTTPPAVLTGTLGHFTQADATQARILIDVFGSSTNMTGRRANGTNASKTALTTDDPILSIGGYGYDGAAYSAQAMATINLRAAQPWTGSNQGTYIQFATTPNNSTTPASAMRINQDKTIQLPGYGAGALITDASGNVSTSSGTGSVFTGSTAVTSAFSATPTFSLADVSAKSPVRFQPAALSANVTSVTFSNKTAGAKFSIAWLQDGTGGRTVSYGASASNTCAPSTTANKTTVQQFEVAADGTTVVGTGCTSDDIADTPVIGPASSTNNAIPVYNGTTGKVLGAGIVPGTGVATALANAVDTSGGVCTVGGGGCAGGFTLSGLPLWPFGRAMSADVTTARSANQVWGNAFVVTETRTFTNSNAVGVFWGNDGGHQAFAIYDSTGTGGLPGSVIANTTTATYSGSGASDQPAHLAFGGSFTLTPGLYYLMSASDTTTPTLYMVPGGNGGGMTLDNGTQVLGGTCANPSTGTTTIVFPMSCGTFSAVNNNITPYVIIWK